MTYTLPGLGGGTYKTPDYKAVIPTTSLVPTAPKTATTQPAPIAADTLTTPATAYQLPTAPQQPDYLGTLAAVPTIDQIVADASTPSKTENTQNTLMSQILESVGKITGRNTAQINAEAQAGLPQLNTQLTDVNNQIQALQKEAAAIPLQIQENFAGRGVTAAGAAPIQTGQLRQNAIKALGLSAIAQTLQGNISLAQSQADKAVELEFAPEEARLTFLSKALELNTSMLSREDSKRAALMQAKLQERQNVIEQARSDRQAVFTLVSEAARVGTDPKTLSLIQNARTPEEALILAGPALSTEFRMKLQQQKFENDIRLQQLALTKAAAEQKAIGNTITASNATDLATVLSNSTIGQGTKTKIGDIFGVMGAIETMANNNTGGKFGGISPFNAVLDKAMLPVIRSAFKTESGINNSGYIGGIGLKVQQWASGAHLSEQQTEDVKKMIPTTTDTDSTVRTKLNNLSNFMNDQIAGALRAEGITYTPPKIDLFAPPVTLENIFTQPL
jgi:2-C-methyl-D-erythritol 4-phosphate cytidylyltransferase